MDDLKLNRLQSFLQAWIDDENPGNFDITEDWYRHNCEKIHIVLDIPAAYLSRNEKLEFLAIEFLSYVATSSTDKALTSRIESFLRARADGTLFQHNSGNAQIVLYEAFHDVDVIGPIIDMVADCRHPSHYNALAAVVTSIKNGERVFQRSLSQAIEWKRIDGEALRDLTVGLLR